FDYSPEQRKAMEKRIGKDSFKISSKEVQNFGIIKKMSPLFIRRGQTNYVRLPLNHKVGEEIRTYTPFMIETNEIETNVGKKKLPTNYCAKNGILTNAYLPINAGNQLILKESDLFKDVIRTGIKTGGEDDSFFRKSYCQLVEGFGFSIMVKIDTEDDFLKETALSFLNNPDKNQIVYMGLGKSTFRVTAEKIEEDPITENTKKILSLKNNETQNWAYAQSDLLVPIEIYKTCSFASTQTRELRTLTTNANGRYSRSPHLYTLIEAGSFFVLNDKEKFRAYIEAEKNMMLIGWNKIIYGGKNDSKSL
ncbi:MAG: hypothetical protein RR961_10060, partial [Eubacterium sp.]